MKSALRVCAAALALASPALAQQPEFAGKTINIYVAGTAGGGIDLYARWFARYVGKHIPGAPSMVSC